MDSYNNQRSSISSISSANQKRQFETSPSELDQPPKKTSIDYDMSIIANFLRDSITLDSGENFVSDDDNSNCCNDKDKVISQLATKIQKQVIDAISNEAFLNIITESVTKVINGRIDSLVKNMEQCKSEIIKLNEKNTIISEEILQLKQDSDNLKQSGRDNNIIIHGPWEELENESLYNLLKSHFSSFVNFPLKNIKNCYRIGKPANKVSSGNYQRPILCSFENHLDKLAFLKSWKESIKSAKSSANSSPSHNIYINNDLTPQRNLIYKNLLKMKKEKSIEFVWVVNGGNVLYKKINDNKVYKVINYFTFNSATS